MREGPLRPVARERTQGTLLRIYLDELTLAGLWAAAAEARRHHVSAIRVLDALPGGLRGRILCGLARVVGVRLDVEEFFAGHLRRDSSDEVSYLAAFRLASPLAMSHARRIVAELPLIGALGAAWGEGPVVLRLARTIWLPIFEVLLRIQVVDALSQPRTGQTLLVLGDRRGAAQAVGAEHAIAVRWYARDRVSTLLTSRLVALWWLNNIASGWRYRILAGLGRVERRVSVIRDGVPAVLMPQEEEPSADWSYRTQPHWLPNAPMLQPVMLGHTLYNDRSADRSVVVVTAPEMRALPSVPGVAGALRLALLRMAVQALWCSRPHAIALGTIARLVYYADRMAATAAATKAAVFVCCENVMIHADAMQLVAARMGVATVAFQYSNMGQVTPAMLTALDRLVTFSPAYHARWTWAGWTGSCEAMGYPFDYAFPLLRHRAAEHRRRLAEHGATFVIAYFDESVQKDRWGLVHPDDHAKELGRVVDEVLEDDTVGAVLKVQFQKNAASGQSGLRDRLEAARRTGRLLELSHGQQRNTVFPAEAALAADITIGHAVGGTASLEAALAGCRSVLLNPYGYRGANDELYARGDVVYRTIDEAMAAIARYRSGDARAAQLGDWSAILPQFDSFRDGGAAQRMASALAALSGQSPAAPAMAMANHA